MPDKLSQILWKEKKKRALSTDGPITGHQSKKNWGSQYFSDTNFVNHLMEIDEFLFDQIDVC